MNRTVVRSAAALMGAVGLFLSAGQASAHVNYGSSLYSPTSVIDPVTGVNGVGSVFSNQNRFVSSNAGWVGGLNATTQMDSHANRLLYFNLGSEATINFTITGTDLPNGTANGGVSAGVLNPGYSIFSGYAPAASHDGAAVPASFLATQTGFATWSPFVGTNAVITAAGGTLTNGTSGDRYGLYRSDANFSMANNSGVVGTLTYLLSGSNAGGNSVTGSYTLGPGVYSLIVGGANATDLATLLTDAQAGNSSGAAYTTDRLSRSFNIAFNVTPVPLPAAVWLFGSGVVGVIAFARRRMSV